MRLTFENDLFLYFYSCYERVYLYIIPNNITFKIVLITVGVSFQETKLIDSHISIERASGTIKLAFSDACLSFRPAEEFFMGSKKKTLT